ncbi:MAG TPA: hypothetical protein VHD89_08865, partial [Rhodanobacteraceae bacterium]|nr:hypothetical protein [Rhodanobacteraceae bacterium]
MKRLAALKDCRTMFASPSSPVQRLRADQPQVPDVELQVMARDGVEARLEWPAVDDPSQSPECAARAAAVTAAKQGIADLKDRHCARFDPQRLPDESDAQWGSRVRRQRSNVLSLIHAAKHCLVRISHASEHFDDRAREEEFVDEMLRSLADALTEISVRDGARPLHCAIFAVDAHPRLHALRAAFLQASIDSRIAALVRLGADPAACTATPGLVARTIDILEDAVSASVDPAPVVLCMAGTLHELEAALAGHPLAQQAVHAALDVPLLRVI